MVGYQMFAQPRLIHKSHVSFYTSRNFYCQEFIELVWKHPGNLWFMLHLHLPEKALRPGWWRMRDDPTSESSVSGTCWLLPVPSQSHTISSSADNLGRVWSLSSVHFCSTLEVKTKLAASHWFTQQKCSSSHSQSWGAENNLSGWCGWRSAATC